MNKYKRNERIGAIVKVINDSPNKIFTLNFFTEMFNSAKSTISEDLVIVKKMMEDLSLGKVVTIAGASGGVKFVPYIGDDKKIELIESICKKLRGKSRIIPGNYLYLSDILYDNEITRGISIIFAEKYLDRFGSVDYVLSIETKGIPLAFRTAEALNVPLVIARNENKASEGPKLGINFISGSTGELQTMYISKKAIRPGSNVLIVDDFMKAGGTAKGMADLVKESDSNVVGICVLMNSMHHKKKLVEECFALINYYGISDSGDVIVEPNMDLLMKTEELSGK